MRQFILLTQLNGESLLVPVDMIGLITVRSRMGNSGDTEENSPRNTWIHYKSSKEGVYKAFPIGDFVLESPRQITLAMLQTHPSVPVIRP